MAPAQGWHAQIDKYKQHADNASKQCTPHPSRPLSPPECVSGGAPVRRQSTVDHLREPANVCLSWRHIAANPRTNIMDFRGFDSNIILILRGGILMSIRHFPESSSQAILVGILLVGRLGLPKTTICYVFDSKFERWAEKGSVVGWNLGYGDWTVGHRPSNPGRHGREVWSTWNIMADMGRWHHRRPPLEAGSKRKFPWHAHIHLVSKQHNYMYTYIYICTSLSLSTYMYITCLHILLYIIIHLTQVAEFIYSFIIASPPYHL